jgi:2-C-methyl-D-erythritol 4-phosphate cytidylyltransferase
MSQARTDAQSPVPFAVVVAAAGAGKRMGGFRKPLAELCGRPVLFHCIDRLLDAAGCAHIIPVLHPEEYGRGELAARLAAEFGISMVVCGGPTRQASALAGLEAVGADMDLVLIHDAARPLVWPAVVERVAQAAWRTGAAIAAIPATETVKQVAADGRIVATPPRLGLWYARTPQGFRKDVILRAHYAARDEGFLGTDDAQLVERLGHEVHVVEDRHDNLKITVPGDLLVAEAILHWQALEGTEGTD